MIEEVKGSCTFAMLQCLDRPNRLAYVPGEIMELSGPGAAEALEISADLFRKRLQHARPAILAFTRSRAGKIRVDSCAFAGNASSFQEARAMVRQVDEARWALEVHRTNHPRHASIDFARRIVAALDARDRPAD